jgi:hypothetical protein
MVSRCLLDMDIEAKEREPLLECAWAKGLLIKDQSKRLTWWVQMEVSILLVDSCH